MPRMSSRRRSRRPRRTFRRRRGGQSTRAIAVKALRATDQELKFEDNTFDSLDVDDASTTGSIVLLNGIAAGTANFNRIGKRLSMRSLWIQLVVERGLTSTANTDYVRLMIVLDKQANQAAPIVTEILQLDTPVAPVVDMWAPLNLNNTNRFSVLWETRVALYNNFIQGRIVRKYLRLSQTVVFDNSGALVADISTNTLWLVAIGSALSGGGQQPQLNGKIRLRFVG